MASRPVDMEEAEADDEEEELDVEGCNTHEVNWSPATRELPTDWRRRLTTEERLQSKIKKEENWVALNVYARANIEAAKL